MLPSDTSFSSQWIGDGFLKIIKSQSSDTPEVRQAIDFVSKASFQSCFGASELVDLVIELISKYPAKEAITHRLLKGLIGSPVLERVANLIETIPDQFFDDIPSDIRSSLAEVFSESINSDIADIAAIYCERKPPEVLFSYDRPIVSLSDVFNENIAGIIDNPSKSMQFVEQFQPFTPADIVDFVWNLVNDNSPLKNSDKNLILPLLRPFKSAKAPIESLVQELDKESLRLCSQSSVQLLLTCLKEVSGARTVPATLFLGQWKNPLTQLNFLSQIVSTSPLPVVFPKPQQIPRAGPVIIGDFKADHWRCPEFVETLAYLYDFKEKGVDEILKEGIDKGPALLLMVLAQAGKPSKFAAHLTRLLLLSPTQYMPGFSALWATNPQFVVDVVHELYENHNSMLGRIVDMIDDLGAFDTFVEMSKPLMAILLHVSAFFRRGHNFHVVFAAMYKKDNSLLKVMLKVFDSPGEFGLHIPMKTERKLFPSEELISADLLFFNFVDEIYNQLEPALQQKVQTLFDKCIQRTSKLLHFTFNWRQKNPPQSPKSPSPVKDSDYLEFAVKPDNKCINRFELHVKSLLMDVPRDKNSARANGHALGKLLAQDLLSLSFTKSALETIDRALASKENSSQFAFAVAALEEMADRLDLYMPFAKRLLSHTAVEKHVRAAYDNAKALVSAEPEPVKDTVQSDVELQMDCRVARFSQIDLALELPLVNTISGEFENNASRAMMFVKSSVLTPMTPLNQQALMVSSMELCLEAASFWMHRLLTAPDARSIGTRVTLTRLGRWIGQNTLAKSSALLARIVDVEQILLYGYRQSRLCIVIPFLEALFAQASPIFMPPNPWTLSVLSILSGIVRLPYLRYSIVSLIMSIFAKFRISPADVEPYPLYRLPFGPYYDNDFLYPPILFGSNLGKDALAKLYDGDIAAIFNIVNRHMIVSAQTAALASRTVRELGIFIYTKVPEIAESAASTAFALSLKDFARSCDGEALKRHARALLVQLVNSLSMMSVSLLNLVDDPAETVSTYGLRRGILNQNCRWLDLLVRQLALKRAWTLLSAQIKPMQKLRSATSPFWDVKSFPPSVAMKVPIQLWPDEIKEQGTYTRPFHDDSLMAAGIYECYDVDSSLKNVYNRFTLNPLSIAPVDVYDSELPINTQLASFIFDNFVVNQESGSPTVVGNSRHFPQFPITSSEISIIATLVFCFQPMCSRSVADYGANLVTYLFDGHQRENKERLQPQIHFLLWQRMPCMRVFCELVRHDLVDRKFVEVLAMNFIDNGIHIGCDFASLVDLLFDELGQKRVYPNERERLLSFVCTHRFTLVSRDKLEELQRIWRSYRRFDPRQPYVQKVALAGPRVLGTWRELRDENAIASFLMANQRPIMEHNSHFWDSLIIDSFLLNRRRELIKILFGSIHCLKDQEQNGAAALQNFLRDMFQTTAASQVPMSYFASVMASVTIHLRDRSTVFTKMFGGFLNDIQSGTRPAFIGAWIHLLPLVIQPLLLDEEVITPTAKLVTALLFVLNRFPVDWEKYPQYRKIYKAIVRIMLLLVHDAPRFVAGCYFDFVTTIPLAFKKLRNIVLACHPLTENVQFMSSALTTRNSVYEMIFSGQFDAGDKFTRHINTEWTKNGVLSLFEVAKFIVYSFKMTVRGEVDQTVMPQHILWQLIKSILVSCKDEPAATVVIEVLFDQIRHDCLQTRFFQTVVQLLWKEEMNWDGVTLQTIIFWVLMSRTRGMEVIPAGVRDLKEWLAKESSFQDILSEYDSVN